MDAYIFACEATQAAIDAVLAMVGTEVRVACPLAGARHLYAAVEDSTALGLFAKIATVASTSGLTGVETYLPVGSQAFAFPTHGLVDTYVGFSFVQAGSGQASSVNTAVQSITGVIGTAVVIGSCSVLVESTGSDLTALNDVMADVESTTGVVNAPTAAGPTAAGAGWPT